MHSFSNCFISHQFNAVKYLYLAAAALLAISCTVKKTERQNVFRYNESKGIATLDPAFARSQALIWPVIQLYNGLVQLDENLKISPCIAKEWEVSSDGRRYAFHLRDDVFFHDHPLFEGGTGRRVVASDFIYSLNRITDPEVASPGAWIFHLLDKNPANNYTSVNPSRHSPACLRYPIVLSYPGR